MRGDTIKEEGTQKGGASPQTGAKFESWRAIFSPWESPWSDGGKQGSTGSLLLDWFESAGSLPNKKREANASLFLFGIYYAI